MGHYRWTEQALFELMGGWASVVPEPAVKRLLATHAHHHAWHAELWHDRLPQTTELDPEALTRPANDAMQSFVALLGAPSDAALTIDKLVGVYRVAVPHLACAYRVHLDATDERLDEPTARALRLALADELDHWQEGELVLQSLLDSEDHVERAGAHRGRLEQVLLAAGGVAGPGTFPGASTTRSGDGGL
jgi:hypothetical protein